MSHMMLNIWLYKYSNEYSMFSDMHYISSRIETQINYARQIAMQYIYIRNRTLFLNGS